MAVDVSSLAIKVTSDGIKQAAKDLDNLSNSAANAEKQVDTLQKITSALSSLQKSATATAGNYIIKITQQASAMNQAASSSTSAAAATSSLLSAEERYIKALELKAATLGATTAATERARAVSAGYSASAIQQAEQLGASIDKQKIALDKANESGSLFNNTLKSMITAFIAYNALSFVKGIVEAADAWQLMGAKLKLTTGTMQEAKVVQQDLFELAQKLRVPLEDAAKLYQRVAVPVQKLGYTSEAAMKQVEFVSLALKLSGATAAEASSVMLQYSQSVNAGRLNGGEFNAVAEGAPIILRAIETELRATGRWTEKTTQTLKDLGSKGGISFDLLKAAGDRALPALREQFASLPLTVDDAMTRVKNAWLKAMGELGEDTGLGKELTKAVKVLEDSIPAIRDTLVSTFNFIIQNFDKIKTAVEVIIGLKFVGWIAEAGVSLLKLGSGLTTAITTFGGLFATVAEGGAVVGGLGLAFGALATPLGIAIPLVTALYAAYKLFFEEAPPKSATTTAAINVDTQKRIDYIQKEINKLNERNQAENKGGLAGPAAPAMSKEMEANLKIIENIKSSMSDPKINATAREGLKITLGQRQAEYDRLAAFEKSYELAQKVNATELHEAEAQKKLNEYRTKNDESYKKQLAMEGIAQYKDTPVYGELEKWALQPFTKKDDAKAAKDSRKEESAREAAIKKYTEENGKLNDQLKEQQVISERIAENGLDYDKLNTGIKATTELERKLNETKDESVKASIRKALATAKEVEAIQEANKAELKRLKDAGALTSLQLKLQGDIDAQQTVYDKNLSTTGMGKEALANQQAIDAINERSRREKAKLLEDNAKDPIRNLQDQLDAVQAYNARQLAAYEEYYKARKAQEADWKNGALQAMADYRDGAANIAGQVNNLFTNAFKGMEDALVNFAKTGKLDFKSLADSIISDLIRIQVKQQMSSFLGQSSGGGGIGGLLGSFFGGGGGNGIDSATGNMAGSMGYEESASIGLEAFSEAGLAFADGGAFTNGIVDGATRFNAATMGEAGPEAIVPLARTADGSLGIKQAGGDSSSGNNGNVYVNSSPTIHIDSRTDQAQIYSTVSNMIKSENSKLVEQMNRSKYR